MLGPAQPRRRDEPIAVSPAALGPADHFSRHLDARLDLGLVREWTRELSAGRGRPRIAPVVLFTWRLVMFCAGIRSERQRIATARLHLAQRWYLGSALDEARPDPSSLTRIHQRLGVAIVPRLFEEIVDRCQAAGLLWGRGLSCDAAQGEANAALTALTALMPRVASAARTHRAALFDAVPGDDPPPDDAPGERLLRPRRPPASCPCPAHHRRARTTDDRFSPTDPDAAPMGNWGITGRGDHDHSVVAGGPARIILAALLTPADVMENQTMLDLLWRVCSRRQIWPRQVTGDARDGATGTIAAVEDAGIRASVPLPADPAPRVSGAAPSATT